MIEVSEWAMNTKSGGTSRRVKWLAYAACGAALLYAAYRLYYALGGTVGMFGTPVSMNQWRLINGVGAAIIFILAVLPVATLPLWQRRQARLVLLALCWMIAVGCVMHALVDATAQHHPYLQTDKPESVTVGGVKGKQLDVVVENLPQDNPGLCGSDCVDIFELSTGSQV